jgi:hypothetical protein
MIHNWRALHQVRVSAIHRVAIHQGDDDDYRFE